ncbi:hypothetical protein [Actinoplanes sp. G11-F43]|uniref:hypothetical protein n=1 Tax=Actinoplanes sp. G11-F43 TaxID=3424130 RepID=UPI003D34AB97
MDAGGACVDIADWPEIVGRTTINGGTGTPLVSIGSSGTGNQSTPICSGPKPSSCPTRGSPSATLTVKTDVMPDG